MWTMFEHECSTGHWTKVESFEIGDKANKAMRLARETKSDSFIFWDGQLPVEIDAQQKIFDQAFAMNEGRLLRVLIGAEVKKIDDASMASCSGNCFCVVAHGKRRCETQYCNANGYCWWVDCGSSC